MKNRKPIHDDWETPSYLLEQEIIPIFENWYGKEYFDPCPINSKFNGLDIEWQKQNYINPPYSRMLKELFIRKAFEESKKGKLCVMLLPVSTSTNIFHEVILPNAEIRFLKGRVKFIGVNTKGEKVTNKCGQHDSMIIIFKPRKSREGKEVKNE